MNYTNKIVIIDYVSLICKGIRNMNMFFFQSASLKRTSRMRTESAAAIAVLRNQRLPRLPRSQDDTDTLINHDSVVIYTERTAL